MQSSDRIMLSPCYLTNRTSVEHCPYLFLKKSHVSNSSSSPFSSSNLESWMDFNHDSLEGGLVQTQERFHLFVGPGHIVHQVKTDEVVEEQDWMGLLQTVLDSLFVSEKN